MLSGALYVSGDLLPPLVCRLGCCTVFADAPISPYCILQGCLIPPSPATGKLLLHGWSKKEKLVVWVEVAKLL